MYWGTADAAWVSGYTGGGTLNLCAEGTYDAAGLCHTITGFTNTYSNEGGKVLVSETIAAGVKTAGGFTTGDLTSKVLSKACITNGLAAVQTGGNLGHML